MTPRPAGTFAARGASQQKPLRRPPEMTKQIKLTPFARTFTGQVRALDTGADGVRTYAISVSSELHVEHVMCGRQSVEILSHDPAAVDMTRASGMPLLLEHDTSKQIGVVESFNVANGRTEAIVRFSRSALGADVEQDVADGIRRNVSIGYRINEMEFEGVNGGGADIYRATSWMPYEVSIVSVPADYTVGVGRAAGDEYTATVKGKDDEAAAQADEAATAQAAEGAADAAGNQAEAPTEAATADAAAAAAATDAPATTEATTAADADAATEATEPPAAQAADQAAGEAEQTETEHATGTADEAPASQKQATAGESDSAPDGKRTAAVQAPETGKRAAEIVKLATKYGHAARADEFLQRGLTVDQAAQELLALTRTNPNNLSQVNENMQNIDMKRYSFARALLVAAGDEKGGYEQEVHEALRSALSANGIQARGFLMPTAGLRAMTAGGAAKGAELVATEHGDLIQAIYDKTVSGRLGVQMLDGLQGNLEFPREVPGLQAHWKGENPGTDVEASELAFGQMTMSPKTLIATTSFSRQLLVQASESVEALVRNRLALEHALKIDQAVFAGVGGLQPTGIYNHDDVGAFPVAGTPDHAAITDMVGSLLAANTLTDSVKVVMTPEVASKLAQTLTASAAGAGFVWQGPLTNGTVSGYEAVATNLVGKQYGAANDEHGFIIGDFSNVVIGNWGTIEIIADPYTKAAQGLIKFTSSQFVDIGVRHGQGFVKATGVKVA